MGFSCEASWATGGCHDAIATHDYSQSCIRSGAEWPQRVRARCLGKGGGRQHLYSICACVSDCYRVRVRAKAGARVQIRPVRAMTASISSHGSFSTAHLHGGHPLRLVPGLVANIKLTLTELGT